jgi:hypothetical protein
MAVNPDHYAGVAPDWDAHAALVYGPIAAELVAATPHPLRERTVLDAARPARRGSTTSCARRRAPEVDIVGPTEAVEALRRARFGV